MKISRRTFSRTFLKAASGLFVPHIVCGQTNPLPRRRTNATSIPFCVDCTGLISYYKMEEAQGSPRFDSSGHGLTLTAHGTDTVRPYGIIGNTVQPGGGTGCGLRNDTGTQWDALAGGYSGTSDGGSGTSSGKDFSFTIWYAPGAPQVIGGGVLMMWSELLTTSNFDWALYATTATTVAFIVTGQASPLQQAQTPTVSVDVTPAGPPAFWTFLAGGWDHTLFAHGGPWLMKNGAGYVNTDAHASGSDFGCRHTSEPFTVGNYSDLALSPAPGTNLFDEVSVWTRKLSQAEVLAIYNAGAACRPGCV